MARPKGAKNKTTIDFVQKYDQLVSTMGIDPVEVLFRLCRSKDRGIRLRAAGNLVNKRFPNQIAVKPVEGQGEFSFSWADSAADNDSLQSPDVATQGTRLN